jgi:hypothetical protein
MSEISAENFSESKKYFLAGLTGLIFTRCCGEPPVCFAMVNSKI